MTTAAPTVRQTVILSAILAHWRAEGIAPTRRDLMLATGLKHINSVAGHLKALKRKGLVELDEHHARGIWPKGLKERIRAAVEEMSPVEVGT